MKCSIKQISALTGYSPATVSNALNRRRGVNKHTAEEILRVAKEGGYIGGGRISTVKLVVCKKTGMVVSDTPFFSVLTESVEDACRAAGYSTVICNVSEEKPDFRQRLEEIASDASAGVLLLATELTSADMEPFRDAACPLVVLDAWFEDMRFDTVMTNNSDSVRLAVRMLLRKGHREIGYLRSRVEIRNFTERFTGFRHEMREQGIPINEDCCIPLLPTVDGAYREMCAVLNTEPLLPTAFLADNDIIALAAIKALHQYGYRIPEDISVIGFDDLPFCEISSPPLSTIKFFQREMGRIAVARLVDRIKTGRAENAKVEIGTEYMERESVREIP